MTCLKKRKQAVEYKSRRLFELVPTGIHGICTHSRNNEE